MVINTITYLARRRLMFRFVPISFGIFDFFFWWFYDSEPLPGRKISSRSKGQRMLSSERLPFVLVRPCSEYIFASSWFSLKICPRRTSWSTSRTLAKILLGITILIASCEQTRNSHFIAFWRSLNASCWWLLLISSISASGTICLLHRLSSW